MMMMKEHTTCPQPYEQLLMGWTAGGMTMRPMTAPWTTTMSHCLWGEKGCYVRFGCTRGLGDATKTEIRSRDQGEPRQDMQDCNKDGERVSSIFLHFLSFNIYNYNQLNYS